MLRIHTLGGLRIENGEGAHLRPRPRECALLLFIAYHAGQWLRRETLADMFWPRSPLPRALHSLSQAIYRLSRSITDFALETEASRLRIPRGSVATDVGEFERLLATNEYGGAVALYEGAFLKGFEIDDVPAFGAWRDEMRLKSDRLAEAAYRKLLERAEDLGNWTDVESYAHALLALNPLDQTAAAFEIALLLERGARGDAERVYGEIAANLRCSDHKISPRLAQIGERVREPPPDWPHEAVADASLPLIGRAGEFSVLKSCLDEAASGTLRAVVVLGTAGVGKTRLCEHLVRLGVIRGFRVLRYRCAPVSRSSPHAAVRELLGGITSQDLRRLAPEWQHVVEHELSRWSGWMSDGSLNGLREARESMFEASAQVLSALSLSAPILMFVDDLQWLDPGSSELFAYVAQRLTQRRVLLIAAARSEELYFESAASVLLRTPAIRSLRLDCLAPEATRDLIDAYSTRAHLPIPRTTADEIARLGGGHPFFLLELLRGSGGAGGSLQERPRQRPRAIGEFLEKRFACLSRAAFELAKVLAVVGRRAKPDLLRRVADLEGGAFTDALEELVGIGFVLDSPEGIRFRHDLVQEAAYAAVLPSRRAQLHTRVARAMRETGLVDIVSLAFHTERGGNASLAYSYAVAAARNAERRLLAAEAERHWLVACDNAASERQHTRAKDGLAECLFGLRQYERADKVYAELIGSSRGETDRRIVWRARRIGAARQLARAVDPAEMRVVLDAALAMSDSTQRLRALHSLVHALATSSDAALVHSYMPAVSASTNAAADCDAKYRVLLQLAQAAAFLGRWQEADSSCEAGLTLAGKVSDRLVLAFGVRAVNNYLRGFTRAAESDYMRAMHEVGGEIGRLPAWALSNWGVLNTEEAAFELASRRLSEAYRRSSALRFHYAASLARANLGAVAYEQGDLASAQMHARATIDEPEAGPTLTSGILALGILGLIALEDGSKEAPDIRRSIIKLKGDSSPVGVDISYAYCFLARMSEREADTTEALERLEEGIRQYADRDFFCHARLELEKARLIGVTNPEAGLALARESRARALEAEAVLLLNKSEALIRELKRTIQGGSRKKAKAAGSGSAGGGRTRHARARPISPRS